MDEEITIINTKTRNEKIKSFFIENKKLLISTIIAFILILLSFYSYQIYKDHQKKLLSDKYNKAIIEFKDSNKSKVILSMKEISEEPSLRDTGTIVDVEHPERGNYLTVGCPIKLSDTDVEVTRSPLLGEHTDEILAEVLDYNADEIATIK